MSVDVLSVFGRPVSLAAVVDGAFDALVTLLGCREVPLLSVSQGWARWDKSWRAVDRAELEELIVGVPAPLEPQGGSDAFTIHVAGLEDRAFLLICEMIGEDGAPSPEVEAVVTPTRTCAGVVLAIAVVLGAAIASEGVLAEEWQLPMTSFVRERVDDPCRFIELTRLRSAEGSGSEEFAAQCERFLRRFPDLQGWPLDRSM